jgi:hypothetical protein
MALPIPLDPPVTKAHFIFYTYSPGTHPAALRARPSLRCAERGLLVYFILFFQPLSAEGEERVIKRSDDRVSYCRQPIILILYWIGPAKNFDPLNILVFWCILYKFREYRPNFII